jgi:hypothetical protein
MVVQGVVRLLRTDRASVSRLRGVGRIHDRDMADIEAVMTDITGLWTVYGDADVPLQYRNMTYNADAVVPEDDVHDGVKLVEIFAYGDTWPPVPFVSVTAATRERAVEVWNTVCAQLNPAAWWSPELLEQVPTIGDIYTTDVTTDATDAVASTSHDCPACSILVRHLYTCAHNTVLAAEAINTEPPQLTELRHKQMRAAIAELRDAVELFRPINDKHFATYNEWQKDKTFYPPRRPLT